MKLIITASIKKVEFEPIKDIFNLDIIKTAAKKSLQGLGDAVKSSNKIPGTCLKKVYLTSSSGAGRVIFLLKLNRGKSVLVMIKMKNDKKVGANMTVQNPHFVKTLDKNLDIILRDLQKGKYEELDL